MLGAITPCFQYQLPGCFVHGESFIYLLHGYQSPFSLFTGMIDENVCFPPSMEPDNTTQTNSADPEVPRGHLRGWEEFSIHGKSAKKSTQS